MSDICDQTAAKEICKILREAEAGRFAPLAEILEAGTPLSARQIARRLKLSRNAATALLADARALVARIAGVELAAPINAAEVHPEVAAAKKSLRPKPAKKRSGKRPARTAGKRIESPAPPALHDYAPMLSAVCSGWREKLAEIISTTQAVLVAIEGIERAGKIAGLI